MRWAATVPASTRPAATSTVRVAAATAAEPRMSSSGSPTASATTPRDPPKLCTAWWASPAGSNDAGSRPNPIRRKIISGELRDDMSANSSISSRSSRRWMERRTRGSASVMKPGLEPVL